MSLNRLEQSLFDYWERQPDERRHWQAKTLEVSRVRSAPGDAARCLERELWAYYVERSGQVPALRDVGPGGGQRISLLNLAELILRLWGPLPKPKQPSAPPSR
jgi:hypothetical protein